MSESRKLIPEQKVLERYHITAQTMWRWDRDSDLKFPTALRIRKRKYRYLDELDAFDERQRKSA
jgi:hypothetical protein